MTNEIHQYTEAKRLHILSIFYTAIRQLPGMLITFYFLVLQNSSTDWFYLIIGITYGIFVFPTMILNYYYFTYSITSEEVVIRSGIISKKQRNIPIKRVQNIELNQNFLQKLMHITKVRIETAGGGETEGSLEFVSNIDAERIRAAIQTHQNRLSENPDDKELESETVRHEDDDLIFSMSLKDVALYGMFRFRPIVFAATAWIISMYQQYNTDFWEELTDLLQEQVGDLDIASIVFLVIVFLLLASLVSWIIDIALTINQYYNFKLKRDGKKLNSDCGLLGSRRSTIPLKKLQMMVLTSNFIKAKFNYYGLRIETAGFAGKEAKNSEIAVPFTSFDRIIDLSKSILKYDLPSEFTKVSRKTIRRAFVRYLILMSFPLTIGAYILPEVAWFILLIPVLYYAAVIRYQHRGFYLNDNTVLIKQGFISRRISVIPINKIQTLNVRATFFQRRLGLSSLIIDTAATASLHDAQIVDIDSKDAEELHNILSQRFIEITKASV